VDLMQAMQAATEDPPPTTIDVDQLITRERRRSRTIDRTLGAAIAAGLVVAALAVPRYGNDTSSGEGPPPAVVAAPQTAATPGRVRSQPPDVIGGNSPFVGVSGPEDLLPPCQMPTIPVPSGPGRTMSPPPKTPGAKPCEVLVPRLRNALNEVLRRELPGMTVTNLDGTPLPPAFRRNWYSADYYKTQLAVGTNGGVMYVDLNPGDPANAGDEEFHEYPDLGGFTVQVTHADGTVVYVSTSKNPGVTKEQALAVARDTALTIF
jgi:hypothetical protein